MTGQPQGRFLSRVENLGLTVTLAAMVLLPLAESALRATLQTGISGVTTIVQHLTLMVGMLGGAIAARENRLLALATGSILPEGRLRSGGRWFAHAFAAAITTCLCLASVQFVASERSAGSLLAYGVPIWVVQLALPLGFGAVALRLLWHASPEWKWRVLAALVAGLVVWAGLQTLLPAEKLVTPALLALLVATLFGAPVFTTLGGAALILFWGAGQPIAAIPLDHYRLVTNR